MNTFQIEVFEMGVDNIMYDVAKDCSDEGNPLYIVSPHIGFGSAFRLTKTEQGWRQVPSKSQTYSQSFIDKVGAEIEKKEPEDFDPEYDEEAELRMMGLDDEETSAEFDWVGDD